MFYICGFQGTVHNRISVLSSLFRLALLFLTDVLSAIRRYNSLYPLITGKTSYPNSASPLMWVTPFLVPFYLIAFSPALFWGSRQPPAFQCRLQHSIIGRFSLNRRVRDGYGCFPEAHRHRKSFVINFSFDNSTVKHIPYFFRFSWFASDEKRHSLSVLAGLFQINGRHSFP